MSRTPRIAAALILAWSGGVSSLAAQQRTLSLDAGTSRTRFADSLEATGFNFSPALSAIGPRGSFNAFGTFSRLAQSWTNSGTLSGTLNTARRGVFAGEIEAIAGGSVHSDGARTGQTLANARLHLVGGSRGAWAGAGLGRTWDGAWRGVLQGEIGGWVASEANSFSAALTPTQVDDTIRFADALFSAQRESPRWELGASLGLRSGDRLPTLPANRGVWGSVGAVYWATPAMGIAACAGTYPVDFTQGYPGGQFVSLSMRFRARGTAPSAQSSGSTRPRGVEPGTLRVTSQSGDARRVRVYAPVANTVEVSGDFTQWQPVALRSDGRGWWSGTLTIPRGTHEVSVRMDGGVWLAPPGLTPMKDEFGGLSGLLVVQ